MDPARLNLFVGWGSMVAGATSGAAIGLYFHRENWLGGYTSLRRRMVRLGHIAFFGLGIINVLVALSLATFPVSPSLAHFGSLAFVAADVTMPTCCFLTAWRERFRVLFPIPVLAVLCGLAALLGGWIQ
jgi:hypothetical protein